jgi:hypothetical protein
VTGAEVVAAASAAGADGEAAALWASEAAALPVPTPVLHPVSTTAAPVSSTNAPNIRRGRQNMPGFVTPPR